MLRSNDKFLEKRAQRAARPVSSGNRMQGNTGGRITLSPEKSGAQIGDDGKVRRLWMPGDPWNDNYYFGGEQD